MRALTCSLTLLALCAGSAQGATITDFTGLLAPLNWTFVTGGNGSVDTSGAPATATVRGSDGVPSQDTATWTIAAPFTGVLTFMWSYTTSDFGGPTFDPAGLIVDGVQLQLTSDSGPQTQSGTGSFLVSQGRPMGFYVWSTDGAFGGASLQVSNLQLDEVPEPATLALTGMGLVFGGTVLRRRRGAR